MMGIDLDALMAEMDNVPFGNSLFQIEHFTDGRETPERRYRHVLLQLRQRIAALKAAEFQRERIKVDLEELGKKLAKWLVNPFDRRRMEIDMQEKAWQLREQETLIKDAMIEVEAYVAMLKKLPKPTREQFEAAEPGHWRKRLEADAKNQILANGHADAGTIKALNDIGVKMALTADKKICFVETGKMLEEQN